MEKLNHNSKKIAVITGASEGIGAALVNELLVNNYKVIAISRNSKKLSKLKSFNSKFKNDLQIFSADVPGIWVQRCIIIFFLLVPLWVILFFRIKFGRWVHKLGSVYNRDWEEPYETHNKNEELKFKEFNVSVEPKFFKKSTLIKKIYQILYFMKHFQMN